MICDQSSRATDKKEPRGGAHKSCLNVQFITCNQADMNSTEITNVIGFSALYLSTLALRTSVILLTVNIIYLIVVLFSFLIFSICRFKIRVKNSFSLFSFLTRYILPPRYLNGNHQSNFITDLQLVNIHIASGNIVQSLNVIDVYLNW